MANFNRVVLLGTLTRDLELRYAQGSNTAVIRATIAVNRKFKDKQEAMFIDVVFFGKQAETLSKYASKGTEVLIEGRLSQNTWEQEGQKRSKHEIIVDNYQLTARWKSQGVDNTPAKDGVCSICGKPLFDCLCDIPF